MGSDAAPEWAWTISVRVKVRELGNSVRYTLEFGFRNTNLEVLPISSFPHTGIINWAETVALDGVVHLGFIGWGIQVNGVGCTKVGGMDHLGQGSGASGLTEWGIRLTGVGSLELVEWDIQVDGVVHLGFVR